MPLKSPKSLKSQDLSHATPRRNADRPTAGFRTTWQLPPFRPKQESCKIVRQAAGSRKRRRDPTASSHFAPEISGAPGIPGAPETEHTLLPFEKLADRASRGHATVVQSGAPPRLPPTRRLVGEWRGIRRQEGRISGATEISEILQIANHSHTIPSRGLAARLRPARTLVGARRGAARRKEGSPKSLKSPRFVRLLNPLIPQKSREYWEFPTSQNPVSSHFPPGGWPADYGLPYNPLRPPGYRLPQIRSANGGRGNGGRHNS